MLIAFSKCKNDTFFSMTDSMNFGPDWIRNLSSEGSTGGGTSGARYQLADFRYGREEMLALFDRNIKPPACLTNFKCLFAETTLPPLALLPTNEEEDTSFSQRGGWQGRPSTLGGPPRGRGGSLERGGRITRGRGGYQSYGRPPNYEGGWGNGEPSDWSPRKEYNSRPSSMDNWRRSSRNNEEDDGWRMSSGRGMHDKWGRSTSWRGEGERGESGPPERGGRSSWHDNNRGPPSTRKSWDDDHLPEWATENPLESGGSFDDRGAFHGSDDEQKEDRGGTKRDGLQKSTSQQHISHKQHPPLLTSKSTMSLVKDTEREKSEETDPPYNYSEKKIDKPAPDQERKLSVPELVDKPAKETPPSIKERAKSEGPQRSNESQETSPKKERKVEDDDLEKLQEEIVLKLVVDEELPQQNQTQNSFELGSNLPPPPNLTVPGQDKWFYQDPQGQMQGPFTNVEMSEWFKAGYFGQDLKVRRQCDERFFLLGELMAMCGGSNPFQTSVRFPVLKNDISKMPESDLLHFQYISQLAAYKQAQARVMADPWSALTVQQQELAAQRLIMQQQQPVQPDLQQYMQQPPPTNPLMHMINQMQQANKLPTSGLLDNKPPNIPGGAMDPHLQMHMNNLLSLQNRLPSGLPNHLPAGMPGGAAGPLPPDNIGSISGLPGAGLGATSIPIPGMPSGLASGLGLNVPRSSTVEHNAGQDISSLLKQLQQKQQQNQVESLWQQSHFAPPNSETQQQWPGQVQQQNAPMSMWDIQQPSQSPGPTQQQVQRPQSEPTPPTDPSLLEKEKEKLEKLKKAEKSKEKGKERDEEKELKKRKKVDEEQQKKEAEEKRKQEQKKLEAEKKAETERKRKEEERIKKQLEKAKKEAEEKRMRELEEKRRLKEQRKLEEEERKKTEEDKRLEEEDRIRKEKELREREERQRAEERRQEQISMSKAAPWSQPNSTFGMSLTEIQKAEKEMKAQEAVLQAQRAQLERELQLQQQQQQQFEKVGGLQLGWAKKAMEPRKVKSLAEIQAEEQERLTKEVAEARLKKEKEAREVPQIQTTGSIWSGQSLSWSNATSTHSQWSSATNISGFWDEQPAQKQQPSKPSTVSKSSSMSTINNSSSKQTQQPKQQQQKPKPKKEEVAVHSKKNHNNNIDDEFTGWCYKALSSMSTTVDIPTFITFLRDIESAFEVREYCKDYLGESNQTQQFANNFLEKRRSFKPKNAHKDDMCSPAPAITPASTQYSSEFQEVKGKHKKSKKSKMLKVDARILGFNVTSAPDRINVGDRDYGDNS